MALETRDLGNKNMIKKNDMIRVGNFQPDAKK